MPLTMHLGIERSHTVGVDIGGHVAKLVVCRWRRGCCSVIGASSLRITGGDAGDGEGLARSLAAWLEYAHHTSCKTFVGSLPSALVDYESLEVPAGSADTSAEHIAAETMHQLLGDEVANASYGYWTSGESSTAPVMHLAWTSADFASQVTSGLARRGWQCIALDAPALALVRVGAVGTATGSRLTVDIGCGEATLVWSRVGEAEYVRNRIRFAPQSAAETLAAGQGISPLAAQTLLQTHGIAGATEDPLAELIGRHLDDWLERLSFEILRTCQFLQNRHGPGAVGEVVLCGGGACVSGLPQELAARTGQTVRAAAPPDGCRWLAAEPYSPLYAQALALAGGVTAEVRG